MRRCCKPRGRGCPEDGSHTGAPQAPGGEAQRPAYLLLHEVQGQGRAGREGGAQRVLLAAALPAQALKVEGGPPVGCGGKAHPAVVK